MTVELILKLVDSILLKHLRFTALINQISFNISDYSYKFNVPDFLKHFKCLTGQTYKSKKQDRSKLLSQCCKLIT